MQVWASQPLPDAALTGYVWFDMTLATGECTGPTFGDHLTGSLYGTCGAATGWGYFSNNQWFSMTWAGASVLLTSSDGWQVQGTFAVAPSACPTEGAASMQAVGAVGPKVGGCLWVNSMMHVSPAVTYTTSMTFAFSIGGCLSGVMTGTCLAATGWGTTSNGVSLDIAWVGNDLTFTGNGLGKARVTEFPVGVGTCATGATAFLANGAAYGLG
jgi:hypothetical protein